MSARLCYCRQVFGDNFISIGFKYRAVLTGLVENYKLVVHSLPIGRRSVTIFVDKKLFREYWETTKTKN